MPKGRVCDVVIVGAGIIGLTVARLLAENKTLQIAVVDAHPLALPLWTPDTPSVRVSALTQASVALFEQLGLWSQIAAARVSPFSRLQVWDKAGAGEIQFDSALIDAPQLGFIVENNLLLHCLAADLITHSNVEIIVSDLSALTVSLTQATLLTTTGDTLQAPLIIGADGANSWVRKQVQIPVQQWGYGQDALVATVQTAQSTQQTAWQHFMPTGPLAFLPLTSADDTIFLSSIVWSNPPEDAARLMQLSEDAFKVALAEAIGQRLGAILAVGKRKVFPLQMRHAKNYVKPRVALVGDAAHTLHPLAGQGMNLGLQDAKALVSAIESAQSQQRDIGSLTFLRHYERARRFENTTMIAAMETFHRLFANQNPLLNQIRNTGLSAVNRFPFLKALFMRYAG